MIRGITGDFAWERRRVGFWKREAMELDGWYVDPHTNPIFPVMIFRHENPNGLFHQMKRKDPELFESFMASSIPAGIELWVGAHPEDANLFGLDPQSKQC